MLSQCFLKETGSFFLSLFSFFLFFSASMLNFFAEDARYSGWFQFLDACLPPSMWWEPIHTDNLHPHPSAVSFHLHSAVGPAHTRTLFFVLIFPAGLAIFPHLLLSSCSYSPRVYFPFEIYFVPSTGVSILCHIDHLLPGVPSSLSHGLLLDVVTFDYSNTGCCFPS